MRSWKKLKTTIENSRIASFETHSSAQILALLSVVTTRIQELANKNFALLKIDPSHPSLQFKRLAARRLHSVRVGLHYRALGLPTDQGVHWFWIGSHADYDRLIGE